MKYNLCALLLLSASLLSFCFHDPPIVKVDRPWSEDFAKGHCSRLMAMGRHCGYSPQMEADNFDAAVVAKMKENSTCNGVIVDDKTQKEYWRLIIDYTPAEMPSGSRILIDAPEMPRWGLVNRDLIKIAGGRGGAKDIAEAVCAVVLGKGSQWRQTAFLGPSGAIY